MAQDNKEKVDTVKIQVQGENITVPMPKKGSKVTVNLEDSSEIIQISVGRIDKFQSKSIMSNADQRDQGSSKRVSFFREVEIGTLTMLSSKKVYRNDSSIGMFFASLGSTNDNEVSMMKITPKYIIPGLSLGITIKEKRRAIKNSNVDFITGFKFRYSNFFSNGTYENIIYKSRMINGGMTYYPDSIVSIKKGDYRARTNFYQLVFPFMLDYSLGKSEFRMSAGINLMLGFNSSNIISSTGENLKSSMMIITYNNPQIIQFQPSVKFYKKRVSVQISTTFGTNNLGFGPTGHRVGRLWHLGVGYRLY